MRYVMRQKWLAWGDDFTINDDQDRPAYQVDGKVFTLGDKLSIHDMAGREAAFIQQRLLAWGPTYEIYRDGRLAAVVKKELFTFFQCRFNVDVPGPDDLDARGDFLDHEYEITRQDRPAARISKRWFSWTDTYGVDAAAGEDDVLLLACAVVIDMVCHDNRNR